MDTPTNEVNKDMKTTILLCLFLVTNCLVSFAQEHGKMGLRVAAGFSTFQGNSIKCAPIPAYSLGIVFLEKNKPFSVHGELAFETKGATYLEEIPKKVTVYSASLCLLSQFKFKPLYKHTISAGVYLSNIIGMSRQPFYYGWDPSPFDMGINAGYKYQILSKKTIALQLDTRFSYGVLNIYRGEHNATPTRNAVAQVGLNFIIGK